LHNLHLEAHGVISTLPFGQLFKVVIRNPLENAPNVRSLADFHVGFTGAVIGTSFVKYKTMACQNGSAPSALRRNAIIPESAGAHIGTVSEYLLAHGNTILTPDSLYHCAP
jgi:hypothetical protein